MDERGYELITAEGGAPIKAWIKGVPFDAKAAEQLRNTARLPFVYKWVAAMPDVHWGLGPPWAASFPTKGAIVPAAVGVDIGCGMAALRTTLVANDLPESLHGVRSAIEKAVPHGFTAGRGRGRGLLGETPSRVERAGRRSTTGFARIKARHPKLGPDNATRPAARAPSAAATTSSRSAWTRRTASGSCSTAAHGAWATASAPTSSSTRARRCAGRTSTCPIATSPSCGRDEGLRRLRGGGGLGPGLRPRNRELMMDAIVEAVGRPPGIPPFQPTDEAVNCHHNYVARETHYGEEVLVTRKGAVRAGAGELGIIPGSMGARCFIVRGKGNPESFTQLQPRRGPSHVAQRGQAPVHRGRPRGGHGGRRVPEGRGRDRRDPGGLQADRRGHGRADDLVDVVHELKQVVCVKG